MGLLKKAGCNILHYNSIYFFVQMTFVVITYSFIGNGRVIFFISSISDDSFELQESGNVVNDGKHDGKDEERGL